MTNITLSIPGDLKSRMDAFAEINWSAVAREAIKRKLAMLEKFKEFTKDSTLTEEDAINLGRELSAKAMERHKAR